jgi:hypothetical protein
MEKEFMQTQLLVLAWRPFWGTHHTLAIDICGWLVATATTQADKLSLSTRETLGAGAY